MAAVSGILSIVGQGWGEDRETAIYRPPAAAFTRNRALPHGLAPDSWGISQYSSCKAGVGSWKLRGSQNTKLKKLKIFGIIFIEAGKGVEKNVR